MKIRHTAVSCVSVALLSAVMMASAHAGGQWFEPKGGALPFVDAGPAISESAAAAAAARASGGRVLGVRRNGGKAGQVDYRVKVLMPDGRIRSVRVDGTTGAVR